MGILEIVFSALIGGLAATLISIRYQHISEKIKNRRNIIITVTEWLDNVYARLQILSTHKDLLLKHGQKSMTSQEYRTMNNEMRILLLSNKIIIEVACIYDEGTIIQQINALRDNMINASRIFWNARKETWDDSHTQIKNLFNSQIDPLREELTRNLYNSLNEISILNLLKK